MVIHVQIWLEETVRQNVNCSMCCAQIYHACLLQFVLDMQHFCKKYRFCVWCERVNILWTVCIWEWAKGLAIAGLQTFRQFFQSEVWATSYRCSAEGWKEVDYHMSLLWGDWSQGHVLQQNASRDKGSTVQARRFQSKFFRIVFHNKGLWKDNRILKLYSDGVCMVSICWLYSLLFCTPRMCWCALVADTDAMLHSRWLQRLEVLF
jgi:hypothetical protein